MEYLSNGVSDAKTKSIITTMALNKFVNNETFKLEQSNESKTAIVFSEAMSSFESKCSLMRLSILIREGLESHKIDQVFFNSLHRSGIKNYAYVRTVHWAGSQKQYIYTFLLRNCPHQRRQIQCATFDLLNSIAKDVEISRPHMLETADDVFDQVSQTIATIGLESRIKHGHRISFSREKLPGFTSRRGRKSI